MAYRKSRLMREIEQRFNEPLETLLPRLYIELGGEEAVAEKLGVSEGTLRYWRLKMGFVRVPTLVKPNQ